MENVVFAFTLTLFAGLSTGIGSVIALLAKKTNTRFLAASLGFSAGVMIYVSMVEIFVKAKNALSLFYGAKQGTLMTIIAFFSGMLLIGLIDRVIPSVDNPHEVQKVESMRGVAAPGQARLLRTGVFTALAVAVHNFPEGLATFIAALSAPTLAISVTVAIAIHNIPEGIAVSVPIYFSTGNRKKAFLYSFLSGLAEPLGAAIGYLVLLPFMSDAVYGFVFAAVAGIMVFISLDELLPSAREYGEHHLSIYGMVLGMLVMAFSLLLFM